jgi:hypothetical protein
VTRSRSSVSSLPSASSVSSFRPVSSLSSVSSFSFVSFVFFLTFVSFVSSAEAQLYESVGIRAQGLAGAFVAVADDATSTWWNPAGLAVSPFFSGIVEHRSGQGTSDESTLGVAFAVPSLGLSYYRLRIGRVSPPAPTGLTVLNRQNQLAAGAPLPSFVLDEVGATVGQSLGKYLVLASTLKLVRADQTRGDFDAGAMVKLGSARFAVSAKNLYAPDLTAGGAPVDLNRQVRVGAAYVPSPGKTVSVIADLDADLTTTHTAAGDERHIAGGAELRSGRLGVRGGLSGNTVGDVRRSFSAGASLALTKGFFVDSQVTRGDDDAKRGWGVALRVAY